MLRQLKNRNFYFMVFGDLALFVASVVLSYLVRFDFSLSASMVD